MSARASSPAESLASPATPMAYADPSGPIAAALTRQRLRRHAARIGVVTAAVGVIAAAATVYLSVVGVVRCVEREGDRFCEETHYYPLTAQMRSHSETKNGVPHGVREEWHRGGARWIAGGYDHGVRVGGWREWYASGALRFSGTYANDKLDGVETWYYENGQREWNVTRVSGQREGVELWWHANGNLRRVGGYRAGEKDGAFTVYDEAGNVAFAGVYDHGEIVEGKNDATG